MLQKIPRKLFRENLNILLIPESGAEIASFRVRRGVSRSVACGLGVTLLLLMVSLRVFVVAAERGRDLAAVSDQNERLRAELYQMDGEIDVLRSSMDKLAEYELRARALAGLHDGDEDTSPLGLGGLEDGPRESGALGTPLHQLVVDAEVELNQMIRGAEDRRRSYQAIVEKLGARNESLSQVPSIHPLEGNGWYSSGYGHRNDPFTGRRAFHAGVDISAPTGTPVHATADGVVIQAGRNGFYGKSVKIDHGNGIVTVYAHNESNLVKKGQRVERGDVIATVGSTGRSTGPHLHYAVVVDEKHVNPFGYILPEDVVVD